MYTHTHSLLYSPIYYFYYFFLLYPPSLPYFFVSTSTSTTTTTFIPYIFFSLLQFFLLVSTALLWPRTDGRDAPIRTLKAENKKRMQSGHTAASGWREK